MSPRSLRNSRSSDTKAAARKSRERYRHALIEPLEERALMAAAVGTAANPAPTGAFNWASSTVVAGWLFDKNAGAAPLTAEIKVDGNSVGTVTANLTRTDLVSSLGSANHGFAMSLSGLAAGPHVIELWTTDNPTGTPVKVATRIVGNTKPVGEINYASPGLIVGWALDPDSPNTAVQVIYQVDGTKYSPVSADKYRPDVTQLPDPAHGFSSGMPTTLFGTHTVRVIAVDTFDGSQTVIATRVFVNRKPTGNLDYVSPNGNVIAGWSYDPDSPNKQNSVLLRLDGTKIVGNIPAKNPRPDLKGAFANHAFGVRMDMTKFTTHGTHLLEVFAVDPDTGVTALLGKRTIVV